MHSFTSSIIFPESGFGKIFYYYDIKIINKVKTREENLTCKLPDDFVQRIENDLNKLVEAIPEIIDSHHRFLKDTWNYSNAFEFLVGMLVGNCQLSYIQAFYQKYGKMPEPCQSENLHRIISRRKIQFEQGVSAFLEENNIK